MDIKKQVQQQFGKHAAHYVTSEIHAKGSDLAALLSISNASKDDTVLDIATGGGHVANAFAPLAGQVTALDLTQNMLEKAEGFIQQNGHSNVRFVQGDAESLPFESNFFTIVTCRIAPHHFPNISSFISESYRVLKEGGTFLLIDNTAPEHSDFDLFYNTVEKKRDYSHNRAFKKSEWISYLEKAGFQIQQLITFPKTFQFASWCDRMSLPEKEKKELEQYMMNASKETQRHFHVTAQDNHVISFQGEAILVKCKK
jgi:ubiquinone/menaquinone biosynthesis C-methylase UbiE